MNFRSVNDDCLPLPAVVVHRATRTQCCGKHESARLHGTQQSGPQTLVGGLKATLLAAFIAVSGITLFPTISRAALVAQSTSTTGSLRYEGVGSVGGGIGSGIYTLGTCAFAAGTTTCTSSGSYVESAQSTHSPGQGGTFTLTMGYPGSGPSPVIARSITAGSDILQFSTVGNAIFTLRLFPSTGGEISGLYPAPVFANSIGFAAFLDPNNYVCTGLSANQVCGIGQVGVTAGETVTGGVNPLQFTVPLAAPPSAANYQGLWWNSPPGSESGWGINFAHQDNVIFASWFTYDLDGKGWWLVMTAPNTGGNSFSGSLLTVTGPAFDALPFDPSQVVGTVVGTGTLNFTDANNGTFAYTVNGISQTKNITREVFGPLPTCAFGAQPNLALARNYQDLWWKTPAASESGWGINSGS